MKILADGVAVDAALDHLLNHTKLGISKTPKTITAKAGVKAVQVIYYRAKVGYITHPDSRSVCSILALDAVE
ncbi:hypothetical protein O7627_36910 [Solwaraspora sp. WMMD1047]|uniref:hypothetical protein n=1 Tax=Solwaraspora sp. WMMD1047 TaxID=3016102 RepID=UPI002417D5AC|nr:hypothetical protein [Solwaraspora sp. WMMD1047]MDG4834852.1 hypothetical protein [Solwaraspora sp. WMMD1047]